MKNFTKKLVYFSASIIILTTALMIMSVSGCNKPTNTNNEITIQKDYIQDEETNSIGLKTESLKENVITEIDTQDWKTYTNSKYNYFFKFPPDTRVKSDSYGITEASMASEIIVPVVKFRVYIQDSALYSDCNECQYVNYNLTDFANYLWKLNKNDDNPNVKNKHISDLTTMSIDGKKAYKFTLTGSFSTDDLGGGYILGEETLYVLTNDGEHNYILCMPTENNYAQAVLNSFSFIK